MSHEMCIVMIVSTKMDRAYYSGGESYHWTDDRMEAARKNIQMHTIGWRKKAACTYFSMWQFTLHSTGDRKWHWHKYKVINDFSPRTLTKICCHQFPCEEEPWSSTGYIRNCNLVVIPFTLTAFRKYWKKTQRVSCLHC